MDICDSSVEIGGRIRNERAPCVQVLISITKRRADMQGRWTNVNRITTRSQVPQKCC